MLHASAMSVGGMAIAEALGRAMGTTYSYSTAALYAFVAIVFLVAAAARGELSK